MLASYIDSLGTLQNLDPGLVDCTVDFDHGRGRDDHYPYLMDATACPWIILSMASYRILLGSCLAAGDSGSQLPLSTHCQVKWTSPPTVLSQPGKVTLKLVTE